MRADKISYVDQRDKSQVGLEIPADSAMSAVFTMDSLKDLGIKEGNSVKVVVKAIHVLLVKE